MAARLQDRVIDFLEKDILTDVTFIVQGQEFKSHKLVIASHPGVLRDHVFKKVENPVDLGDAINPEVFKDVLRYIYTDEVSFSKSNIFELLQTATALSLEHLEEKCCDYLLDMITCANLGEFTKQAIEFNSMKLQEMCASYFGKFTQEILESSEFLEFSDYVLKVLVSSQQINCLEIFLFDFCVKWAQNKCRIRKLDTTPENLRLTLNGILDKIRFSTMAMEDFLGKVVKTKIVEPFQIGVIIPAILENIGAVKSLEYRTVLMSPNEDLHEQVLPAPVLPVLMSPSEDLQEKVLPAPRRYSFSQCRNCELDQVNGLIRHITAEKFGCTIRALLVTDRYIRPGHSNYIEIEISSLSYGGVVAVGIVPSDYGINDPYGRQPGWDDNSVGYHSDDGWLFVETGLGTKLLGTCGVGDRMGVGVIFSKGHNSNYPSMFYFTRNGETIYRSDWSSLKDGSHHFAIGMRVKGDTAVLYDSDMWLPETVEQA